jgi:hypothetical protein
LSCKRTGRQLLADQSESKTKQTQREWKTSDLKILFRLPFLAVPKDETSTTTFELNQKIVSILDQWMLPAFGQIGVGVSKEMFAKIMQATQPQNLGHKDDGSNTHQILSDSFLWRVVSLSLSTSCTNLTKAKTLEDCSPAVGLIIQPIVNSNLVKTIDHGNSRSPLRKGRNLDPFAYPPSLISSEDYAIHLVFRLPQKVSYLDMAGTFRRANEKIESLGLVFLEDRGLGVHPAYVHFGSPGMDIQLEKQDQDLLSRVLQIHRELLANVCKEEYLISAEVLVTSGIHELPVDPRWSFWSFSIGGGDLIPNAIGYGLNRNGKPTHAAEISTNLGLSVDWKSRESENGLLHVAQQWLKLSPWNRDEYLSRKRDEIELLATKIDNPTITSAHGTDCVSCHYSTTLRYLANDQKSIEAYEDFLDDNWDKSNRAESFKSAYQFYKSEINKGYLAKLEVPVPVRNLAVPSVPPLLPEYNFHQFSYFFHRPSVSHRAALEAAFAVAALNNGGVILKK